MIPQPPRKEYGVDSSFYHKIVDSHNNRKIPMQITLNSADRLDPLNSTSAEFVVNLPKSMWNKRNIDGVALIDGHLPNFLPNSVIPYLFLSIEEFRPNVFGPGEYFDILRYQYTSQLSPNQTFLKIMKSNASPTVQKTIVNRANLQSLTLRIYDPHGSIFSFGTDAVRVNSVTNAATPLFTTAINHGLSVGDRVYIREFANASTKSVKNFIEAPSGWLVSAVPALNTFEIAGMNLSGEAANQNKTEDEDPYALGLYSYITKLPEPSAGAIPPPYTFTPANPTVITTPVNHNLTTGDLIKIRGFDNGSTTLINNLINRTLPVTVVNATQFSIDVDTSAENPTQARTNTSSPYALGQDSVVLIDKLQTSFDLYVESYITDNVEGLVSK